VLSDFRALFQDARKLASLDSLANAVQLGTENESLLPNEQPLERLPENSAYLWTLTHAITQSIYSTEIMVMEWILTLAFEQDIYLPTELTRMYWYGALFTLSLRQAANLAGFGSKSAELGSMRLMV